MTRDEHLIDDRRLHPRAPYATRAAVRAGADELGDFAVEDISASGARLSGAPPPPPIGSELDLTLMTGSMSGVRLRAEVVRCDAGGDQIGVRFSNPPSRIESLIQEVVLEELCRAPAPDSQHAA